MHPDFFDAVHLAKLENTETARVKRTHPERLTFRTPALPAPHLAASEQPLRKPTLAELARDPRFGKAHATPPKGGLVTLLKRRFMPRAAM